MTRAHSAQVVQPESPTARWGSWYTHCVTGDVRSFLSILLFAALCRTACPVEAAASREFPFRFRGGLLWVEVSVERADKPLNFLVDTGAGVSVIDQRVMERLRFKPGRRVAVTGVQVATTGFWPQRIAATFGGVALPRDLLAVDLAGLGRACEAPVDGLIGADFFRGKVVQIDFQALMMRLLTAEQARQLEGESLALDIRSCGMRVPVSVNGNEPQWLRLDTGCVAPLHWVTTSVDTNLCRQERAIGLAEVSLPRTAVTAGLGTEKFEQVAAVIHGREIFAGEAGLLGNGLLARFAQVTVDTKGKRLVLTK